MHYLIGTAYTSKKEYEKAVEAMLDGIKLNPEHPLMYNNLGSCYLALKKIKEAQQAFEKSTELNPKNATGFYNLATAYQLQQKHEEAFKYFQKAYELQPDEFYLTAAAMGAINANSWAEAINYYQKLIIAHPEKQNFQYNLAIAYQESGKYTEAIKILAQLVTFNPKFSHIFCYQFD